MGIEDGDLQEGGARVQKQTIKITIFNDVAESVKTAHRRLGKRKVHVNNAINNHKLTESPAIDDLELVQSEIYKR